jgi:CubicO group peptidase (beta-lactamase class C family)
MQKINLLIAFLFIQAFSHGQLPQSEQISTLFKQFDQSDAPGFVVGVFQDGETVSANTFGLANLEYDIPNTEYSVFRTGSISKQFTAACVVLLSQRDQVNLADPLAKFFPDFPSYSSQITVQHLLNHTSGIRDYFTISSLKGLDENDYFDDDEVMRWLVNNDELNFLPGEEFMYSNSGYFLLGKIVELVSGLNLADFARNEIFVPLEMNDTHFHNDHTRIVKNRATGYMPFPDATVKISTSMLELIGSGGVFSTLLDMKKWDDAFYDSSVLNAEFWEIMTNCAKLNDGKRSDYACGLFIEQYRGNEVITHSGAYYGFRTEFIRFPKHRLSVLVLANREDVNPTGMAFQVAELYLEKEFKNSEANTEVESPQEVKLKPAELGNYVGHYWNSEMAYFIEVYFKKGTLHYLDKLRGDFKMKPIGSADFQLLDVPIEVTTKFSNGGVEISANGDPAWFTSYTPVSYTTEDLRAYEGMYFSAELDVTFECLLADETLMLRLEDGTTAPFHTVAEDVLWNESFGVFRFERNDAQHVSGFRLEFERVKNLQFNKRSH